MRTRAFGICLLYAYMQTCTFIGKSNIETFLFERNEINRVKLFNKCTIHTCSHIQINMFVVSNFNYVENLQRAGEKLYVFIYFY